MTWLEHVARVGEREVDMEVWWGNLREDRSVGGWILLTRIFKREDCDAGTWNILTWNRIRNKLQALGKAVT
jgi:hypothetical protein